MSGIIVSKDMTFRTRVIFFHEVLKFAKLVAITSQLKILPSYLHALPFQKNVILKAITSCFS